MTEVEASEAPHKLLLQLRVSASETIYLANMRWRGVDAGLDFGPFEDAIKEAGLINEISSPGIFGQSATAADIDGVGYKMLMKDLRALSNPKTRIVFNESMGSATLESAPGVNFELLV